MRRNAANAVMLPLLCALSLYAAQGPSSGAVPAASRPDIFLITLDTVRADHLEPYGYKQVSTPALNRLAADGVRFDHAFTPSPITNTSHASILTGLLPSSHGVADFAVPLATEQPTIAERLRQRGYQTGAFIGAVILDSKSLAPRFDRGFEYYFSFPSNLPKKSSRYGRVERRAADTLAEAQRWLLARANRARPTFIWIHLYDPHDPYDPPAPYSEQYRSRPYDGELAYADSQLLKFLDFLRQQRRYESSLIIAVGDHGEGLGEHGEDTHGILLYDSTLRVPLIVKLPAQRSAGTTVAAQVRTTDILPTVFDLLGGRVEEQLDGESLMPLIRGEASAERVALGETDYPLRYGWAPIKSARTSAFKYIDAPQPELYDLRADPGERRSIYEPWNPEVAGLRALTADLREKSAKQSEKNQAAPDPQTIEELKALGYLGTNPGSTTASGPSLLPDPKEKIELHNLLHSAMLADEEGDSAHARKALEAAVKKDPKSPVALLQLGQLELAEKNFPAAADYLSRARVARPEDASAALAHGKALQATGDLQGAQEALEASLKLSAGQFEARYLLGRVYAGMKNWNAAQDQLEAAIFLNSKSPQAYTELARVLLAQKKFKQAAEQAEQARSLSPTNADVFDLLAEAYTGLGQRQKAAVAAQQAAALRKKQGASRGALKQP
ncbi:MAG: sulfatase-like hydrolase/transferase [Acidobacteriales bacterium]|nr:sulfatase-like hydrolase/transferase [Terriglobales bacterium]